MEIFPETLKKLWNLWEIRSLLLLSLSLQIILILFGSRRKINNSYSWIGILLNVIVWCAYISADWVATVALSVMASNEADCGQVSSNATDSLQAFWAPFLLLHLGGPDTIWHIVTDESYKEDLHHVHGDANKLDQDCKISKWLSNYMLYLLLFRSSMLPKGIGEIRYNHTYVDAERTYKVSPSKHGCRAKEGITSNEHHFSLFEQAQDLGSHFKDLENGGKIRWDLISEVWLEMLAYAAHNCNWKEHAQHLRNGGELLTHVGVLMVNFRLNKQVM